mmetsp:Transcript_36275/g.95121  ORF Transcript_36275/g.95121 Transcript_36275/m.95121 type:complete len:98 (-) Transcript_36275:16-309(-)
MAAFGHPQLKIMDQQTRRQYRTHLHHGKSKENQLSVLRSPDGGTLFGGSLVLRDRQGERIARVSRFCASDTWRHRRSARRHAECATPPMRGIGFSPV